MWVARRLVRNRGRGPPVPWCKNLRPVRWPGPGLALGNRRPDVTMRRGRMRGTDPGVTTAMKACIVGWAHTRFRQARRRRPVESLNRAAPPNRRGPPRPDAGISRLPNVDEILLGHFQRRLLGAGLPPPRWCCRPRPELAFQTRNPRGKNACATGLGGGPSGAAGRFRRRSPRASCWWSAVEQMTTTAPPPEIGQRKPC